jgi:long-chain acyl-CoA synthetase
VVRSLIAEDFDTVARHARTRPAVVDAATTLPYHHLLRWSEAISAELNRHRLDGCRVALLLPNSAAFVAAFFGVARVGGVAAPLDEGYRSRELERYLADMDAAAVLACPATARRLLDVGDRLARKPALLLIDEPGGCETVVSGAASDRPRAAGGDPPLLLLHTSGSTGPAKRVIRTHAQIVAEVETLRTAFATTAADRFLGVAPFSHVNGLVRSMLTAMLTGASLYPVRQFAPRTVLQLVSAERLTVFGGVPRMFALLAQAPPREAADLSKLRIVFSSSAPLVPRDNRDFHRAYGHLVRQLYGSTETGTITYNDHARLAEHLESVGRPLPGVRLVVLDRDGRRLPPGREGEIAVASPFAVRCYEGNATATAASFRDGWYLTGDLGWVDADGYVTLTGRKSLMINRGGYKVNPHEVEETIRQHPKVVDVAVSGAPTPHGDQAIHCFVVVSEQCSSEEIVLHCRDRIVDYKIPSRVEFRQSLPRTATGKILRHRL